MRRPLSDFDIELLEKQGCTSADWAYVEVDENIKLSLIRHTHFSGRVSLGKDVCLDHVGVIENYWLDDHVTICRVNELVADEIWSEHFYNEGITVKNEAGGMNIRFKPVYNEYADWIELHYPQYRDNATCNQNNREIRSEIRAGSIVRNSGVIHNVNMASNVVVEGAANLEYGQLHEGCYIGVQVIARNFSIGVRTKVTDGAKLYHVIATNDCKIGKGFTAENCYFSHHSELFCGEACAIFAGPHTVSHHKSTLLIGGEFSFYNAGSNTNQSNHAYKLGPVHHGTLARGSKTASGNHILWPMQTAPFTMVMGKVETHPDLTALPFSYVIADSGRVYIAPGVNIGTAGTFRDVLKWAQRGKSFFTGEYEFLSPFVMQHVFKGIQTLDELQRLYGTEVEEYLYNGTIIRRGALLKGLARYQLAVRLYASKITPTEKVCEEAYDWHWIDIAGFPAVEEKLTDTHQLLKDLKSDSEDERLAILNNLYEEQAYQWGVAMLTRLYGEEFTNGTLWEAGKQAMEEWKTLLIADAHKEQTLGDMNEELVDVFIRKVEKETIIR